MKRLFGYALMLALAAAPALAKNSQSVNLGETVKVGSTQIPAGDCKVTWEGSGDTVQVTLVQSGKSVTVPAKLVAQKHDHKGYTVSRTNGTTQLESIELSNVSLHLLNPTTSGQ